MKRTALSLVLSCEHARHRVPHAYRDVLGEAESVLRTHRGYDPGALELARVLADGLGVELFVGGCSRLLVELNRSVGHRALWSEYSRQLSPRRRGEVLRRFYFPYRRAVENRIRKDARHGRRVYHLSVHSFTPVWEGQRRKADVGLLYDPRRQLELAFCRRWQAAIQDAGPHLRVRRNYPYLGRADGFTTHLRRCFPPRGYVGIELEVNQAIALGPRTAWKELQAILAQSLTEGIEEAATAPA